MFRKNTQKPLLKKDFLKESSVIVMIPVFNDWDSLSVLLEELASTLDAQDLSIQVLIVDDASTKSLAENFQRLECRAISKIGILSLRRNLGHQRAIAIGLAYIEENLPCEAVLVMDGDGEDQPSDVARLINRCKQEQYERVIFAKRAKRSEDWTFKVFYILYKSLYKSLTGQKIEFGNFSIIPYRALQRLVVVSELWNHYAAAILKSRIPYAEMSCTRGRRFAGKSKMNFVSLVIHGLSAISVFGDVLGVRLLILSSLLILLALAGIIIIIAVRLFTDFAILGWSSTIASLFFIILMQAVLVSLFFIFSILGNRNSSSFIPQRDYKYFVLDFQDLSTVHSLSQHYLISG